MAASIELGFEFELIGGATTSLSSSYENQITRSVSEVSTYSSSFKRKTSCTAKGNEGTGMWQWVVRTSDGSILTKDDHTICKTGLGYN